MQYIFSFGAVIIIIGIFTIETIIHFELQQSFLSKCKFYSRKIRGFNKRPLLSEAEEILTNYKSYLPKL